MAELRAHGIEPEALVAMLARLGTSDPVDPALDADALASSLNLSHFGRAPARFDEAELQRINAAVLHRLPYARVAAQLPEGMTEPAWLAIRANLTTISEAAEWWQVITGPVSRARSPTSETRVFLDEAADAAAAIEWERRRMAVR